ncbi:MAG: DUF4382 domain-containing protein [Dehalococcoidia bacterium]
MKKYGAILVSLLLVALLMAGCASLPGGTSPQEDGYMRLLLSDDDDEDTAIGLFSSVNVTICGIAFQPSGSDDWIEPEDFEPVTVDLLDLVGKNATAIWEGYIEPGVYSKVRIYVCGATVTLTKGIHIDIPIPPDGIVITIPIPFVVKTAGPTVNFVFDITIEVDDGQYRIVPRESESGPDQEYREIAEDLSDEEIEFKGTILAIADDIWTVSLGDVEWFVNVTGAEIGGTPAIGLMAEIEGTIDEDGIIVAVEIELVNGE